MVQNQRLKDIVGRKEHKKKLEDIIEGIEYSELYKVHGVSPATSFLFYGVPGTGKTYSVEAIVNELKASGKNVLYLKYDIGRFGTPLINQGAVNLKKFFNTGQLSLKKGGLGRIEKYLDEEGVQQERTVEIPPHDVVIYQFDECDAVMGHRGGRTSHKEDDKLLEELMKQLQRINNREDNKEYVFLMTNFFEGLDQAAIRRGRVDYRLEFALPNPQERNEMFEREFRNINDSCHYGVFDIMRCGYYASKTSGFSYADIHSLVQEATREHVRSYIVDDGKITGTRPIKNSVLEKLMVEYGNQKRGVGKRRIGF